jgi:uracil-DNA glycosylase
MIVGEMLGVIVHLETGKFVVGRAGRADVVDRMLAWDRLMLGDGLMVWERLMSRDWWMS